jgi:hypothetical protein
MMYKMKNMMIAVAVAACSLSATAQETTQEGIKMYNYKKYQSAERILTPLAAKDPIANYYLGLSFLEAGNLAQAGATFAKYRVLPGLRLRTKTRLRVCR